MTFGQYCRIEDRTGKGVACTNREFIKASWSILSKEGQSATNRERRHIWQREGLVHLEDARQLYKEVG